MSNTCPRCGTPLECLGGRNAHPTNFYCPHWRCGYESWGAAAGDSKRELRELVLSLSAENRALKVQIATYATAARAALNFMTDCAMGEVTVSTDNKALGCYAAAFGFAWGTLANIAQENPKRTLPQAGVL